MTKCYGVIMILSSCIIKYLRGEKYWALYQEMFPQDEKLRLNNVKKLIDTIEDKTERTMADPESLLFDIAFYVNFGNIFDENANMEVA